MKQIYLFLTNFSKELQPFMLKWPFLLRIKEAIKWIFFFHWRGRNTDVYIISFPKSGRTWLRVLIGKALAELFDLDDRELLDTYKITCKLNIPVIQFTHHGTDIQYARAYNDLSKDKNVFMNKKVIFLARDPRDLIVSNYFQAKKRENAFNGDLSEFIKNPQYGIRKILNFYKIWASGNSAPDKFLFIKYEDLHDDPKFWLKMVLDYIGISDIDPAVLQKAEDFASFDNMKRLEKRGYFFKTSMRPGDKDDQRSYKVRKGEVGSFKEELSSEDLRFIQHVIEEVGSQFYPEV